MTFASPNTIDVLRALDVEAPHQLLLRLLGWHLGLHHQQKINDDGGDDRTLVLCCEHWPCLGSGVVDSVLVRVDVPEVQGSDLSGVNPIRSQCRRWFQGGSAEALAEPQFLLVGRCPCLSPCVQASVSRGSFSRRESWETAREDRIPSFSPPPELLQFGCFEDNSQKQQYSRSEPCLPSPNRVPPP